MKELFVNDIYFCGCGRQEGGLLEQREHQLKCVPFQKRGNKSHRRDVALEALYRIFDSDEKEPCLNLANDLLLWRQTWGDIRVILKVNK